MFACFDYPRGNALFQYDSLFSCLVQFGMGKGNAVVYPEIKDDDHMSQTMFYYFQQWQTEH